ncbi:MAG TPA: hypothetical protein VEQ58_22550, partial [Polyangiaceae bacterium]|nr:hypothetical protein [Polyangiaceae bacterium]
DDRVLKRHGLSDDAIAGFVSLDGIFDLKAALPTFSSEQAAVMRQLFGPDDARLAQHSPIAYARPEHPPLLFVDSTGDAAVCRDAFRQMKARLATVGSPARFVELPGLEHNEMVIRIGMNDDPVLPTLIGFIQR